MTTLGKPLDNMGAKAGPGHQSVSVASDAKLLNTLSSKSLGNDHVANGQSAVAFGSAEAPIPSYPVRLRPGQPLDLQLKEDCLDFRQRTGAQKHMPILYTDIVHAKCNAWDSIRVTIHTRTIGKFIVYTDINMCQEVARAINERLRRPGPAWWSYRRWAGPKGAK